MEQNRSIECLEGHGRIMYTIGDVRLTYTEDGKFTISVGEERRFTLSPADSEDLWSAFVAHNEYMAMSRDMGIHTVRPSGIESSIFEN